MKSVHGIGALLQLLILEVGMKICAVYLRLHA